MIKAIANKNCLFLGKKVMIGDTVELDNKQYESWVSAGFCDKVEAKKATKKKVNKTK